MGRTCRRASQRPLARADCLPDRAFHRRAFAELIVLAGHRTHLVLQEKSQCQPERFTLGFDGFLYSGSRRTVRHRTGHRESGRMVRAVLRQHLGTAV